jgi:hypothetical protein
MRGNLSATVTADVTSIKNEVLKSGGLFEAKGIIETSPEVCNGGSIQQNGFQEKNSGGYFSFSIRQKITTALIMNMNIISVGTSNTSIYLYNCSILI